LVKIGQTEEVLYLNIFIQL